jgi:hypothetical protein
MHKIKFKYKNATHEAIASAFTEKREKWYLINLHDCPNFVVVPADEHTDSSNCLASGRKFQERPSSKDFIQASACSAAGLVPE